MHTVEPSACRERVVRVEVRRRRDRRIDARQRGDERVVRVGPGPTIRREPCCRLKIFVRLRVCENVAVVIDRVVHRDRCSLQRGGRPTARRRQHAGRRCCSSRVLVLEQENCCNDGCSADRSTRDPRGAMAVLAHLVRHARPARLRSAAHAPRTAATRSRSHGSASARGRRVRVAAAIRSPARTGRNATPRRRRVGNGLRRWRRSWLWQRLWRRRVGLLLRHVDRRTRDRRTRDDETTDPRSTMSRLARALAPGRTLLRHGASLRLSRTDVQAGSLSGASACAQSACPTHGPAFSGSSIPQSRTRLRPSRSFRQRRRRLRQRPSYQPMSLQGPAQARVRPRSQAPPPRAGSVPSAAAAAACSAAAAALSVPRPDR
jgi:hypothetical protein